jgi:hypothetical protein
MRVRRQRQTARFRHFLNFIASLQQIRFGTQPVQDIAATETVTAQASTPAA